MPFLSILDSSLIAASENDTVHLVPTLRPPPPQKIEYFEKTSKLSFYYRKMQRNSLFQNICNFLKKDQVLSDFRSQL